MSDSKVLTQDYINENSVTDEGTEYIREYLANARIAFGVTNLLGYLGGELKILARPLTLEEAQNACSIIVHCLKKTPHAQILEYIKSCEEDAEARRVFEPSVEGGTA